jgi:uncharacterized protein YbcC (UPF0753/DUF2309 family)
MSGFDSVTIGAKIERAAERIGRVWPLYADVGANPLSGFEDRPFPEAVAAAERLFDGRGYPTAARFRAAWEDGRIDPAVLREVLDANGVDADPETLLDRMAEGEDTADRTRGDDETLDRLLSKWLAAFLDQGQAAWPMPNRTEGFYAAWRELAPYDDRIPASASPVATHYHERLDDLPETAPEAIYAALSDHPEEEWEAIFEHHLAALPGWVGFIKQRSDDDANPWQGKQPVSLLDYVAVRLILAKHIGATISPEDEGEREASGDRLSELWLTAWERSYRNRLIDGIDEAANDDPADDDDDPDAQLVFCIDTRSERLRRHLEATGPYETFGYAGFFGVPVRYEGYGSTTATDSCPVMVDPNHRVTERPRAEGTSAATVHDRWNRLTKTGSRLLKSLKNDVTAAFGLVEASGSLFGGALLSRTLWPSSIRELGSRIGPPRPATFCTPTVDGGAEEDTGLAEMSIEQRTFYAEAAFDLLGWEEFSPVVVFTGHRSETVNNPYESSIDCGACAGSPGTPNARTLATICNDPDVRERLRDRGIDIPSETVFLAGEHNTTTDEVTVFVDEDLSSTQREVLDRLDADLDRAQEGAAAERLAAMGVDADDAVAEAERRTADWAEPRPEVGLAGNAGFVIGPRRLTERVDLEGRCFLHTYDWRTDPDGEALENVMSGPLVVCQMISAQYYFSTVDNEAYGSGSKTTHNAVGRVGVLQGNGGDLMVGLPLQSLYDDDREPHHQPLRLSVVVHAPVETVSDVLARSDELTPLFDNEWLSLTVRDPTQDDAWFRYRGDLNWERRSPERTRDAPTPTTGGV